MHVQSGIVGPEALLALVALALVSVTALALYYPVFARGGLRGDIRFVTFIVTALVALCASYLVNTLPDSEASLAHPLSYYQGVARAYAFVHIVTLLAMGFKTYGTLMSPSKWRTSAACGLVSMIMALLFAIMVDFNVADRFGAAAAHKAMPALGSDVWMQLSGAAVMLVMAYVLWPGERRHYPWWWYAAWMGTCGPVPLTPFYADPLLTTMPAQPTDPNQSA